MHILLASLEPPSASGHPPHTITPLPTIPLPPRPKELASPSQLLQPGPHLHTTCCAIMSGPFTSDPARGHSQGPEEGERQAEEGRSVARLWTFLAGSPGAQGAVGTGPAVAMLCMARTLQPPVGTPGEEVTLNMMEEVEDSRARVDREEGGSGGSASCWLKKSWRRWRLWWMRSGIRGPHSSWRRRQWRSKAWKVPKARVSGWR